MDISILTEEHKSNLNGYKVAMEHLESVINDPDTMDGVICMDKNHRLMFDIDYLNDKIMEHMEAKYRDYCNMLADVEVSRE